MTDAELTYLIHTLVGAAAGVLLTIVGIYFFWKWHYNGRDYLCEKCSFTFMKKPGICKRCR